MDLHRGLADAKICGDLFAKPAAHDLDHKFHALGGLGFRSEPGGHPTPSHFCAARDLFRGLVV